MPIIEAGTYVFKDDLEFSGSFTQSLEFICSGFTFTNIRTAIQNGVIVQLVYGGAAMAVAYVPGEGFIADFYKAITIPKDTTVGDDFNTWFGKNTRRLIIPAVEEAKAKIQDLIGKANKKTNKGDTELTKAVNSLIAGYGSGSGSGGECSGTHVIEVYELPTEGIVPTNLYKMGDTYYKYSDAFKDILVVYNSTTMSIVEEYAALGMTFELYYVKTRPTEDIVVSNQSAMMLACYYVEDENDILAYGDLNGTGAYGWMSMITSMEAINGGAITSASQASQEGAMYALVEAGWKKYSSKNLIVEVDDLPTAGIEKTNLYKVDNTYFKYVITMVDLVVATNYGKTSLVAYYESKGYTVYLHYTENYNNLAPEDIIPTVKGATAGCYYDESRNDTFVYTNDLWVSLSTILAEEGLTFANGGAISDASYARAGGYFAVINSTWQPLGAEMYTGEVVIE